jgi:hypothetical protein
MHGETRRPVSNAPVEMVHTYIARCPDGVLAGDADRYDDRMFDGEETLLRMFDGEDPLLRMVRTAPDTATGWKRVGDFGRGGTCGPRCVRRGGGHEQEEAGRGMVRWRGNKILFNIDIILKEEIQNGCSHISLHANVFSNALFLAK